VWLLQVRAVTTYSAKWLDAKATLIYFNLKVYQMEDGWLFPGRA
jgi:hypothetical protein